MGQTTDSRTLHPEADLRKQRANANVVRANLYNQGLQHSGVTIAFMAVQWATRDCELAWEAARQHELQMLGEAVDIVPTGRDARSDRSGITSLELQRRRDARQAEIDRVRGLANPFAAVALLTGLERAA